MDTSHNQDYQPQKARTMKKILSILGVLFIYLNASAQYKIGNYDLSTNNYFYQIPTVYASLSKNVNVYVGGTIYFYFVQLQDKLPIIGIRLENLGKIYKNFILWVESTEENVHSAEDNTRFMQMNCTNDANEKFTLKFIYINDLIPDESKTVVSLKGPYGTLQGTFQGIYDIRKVSTSNESMNMMKKLIQYYRDHYGI